MEEDQAIKIVEETENRETKNTDSGTTSNEAYFMQKIFNNFGKHEMINEILMTGNIFNVPHKIDNFDIKIDFQKN